MPEAVAMNASDTTDKTTKRKTQNRINITASVTTALNKEIKFFIDQLFKMFILV